MNDEQKISAKFGRQGGFKVPEGFLDDIYARVEAGRGELPEFTRSDMTVGRWQRIRPYVYMAAMFAGIWCMMKVFTIASDNAVRHQEQVALNATVSLDNPPQLIAEVAVSPEVAEALQFSEEVNAPAVTEYELEQDVQESYGDFEQFEQAFDYEFEDRYADIDVDDILAEVPDTELSGK